MKDSLQLKESHAQKKKNMAPKKYELYEKYENAKTENIKCNPSKKK